MGEKQESNESIKAEASRNDKELQKSYPFHTARIGEVLYNIDALKDFAETIAAQEVDSDSLKEAVAEGHFYWIDKNGENLGPYQILQNWEEAQKNPDWEEHVKKIQKANLSKPIWVTKEGFVFDGMHRLTRAFLDKTSKVKIKIFDTLPDSAVVNE